MNQSWRQTNLKYTGVGAVVGVIICIIQSAYSGQLVSLQRLLMNTLFSVLITLSITNSMYFFERVLKRGNAKFWQFILIYYSCNILGLFIGIELSYGVVSLVFHKPFVFMHHYDDYRFSLFIVLIVSTVIYFYQAQRNALQNRINEKELDVVQLKQLKTQAELQTLQSKINPHFLYNSLNSIASLVHEDADKAEEMTLKLARLFRYSINAQQENMASVMDEMEMVNTYLDREKVRFGDRINFTRQVNDDVLQYRIPRFLIQPLVENALKHGLNNKATGGELNIAIAKNEQEMMIIISDNGTPFPEELHMGYGLQSTYDKLNLLYNDAYRLQIGNVPEKHIKITLPLTAA